MTEFDIENGIMKIWLTEAREEVAKMGWREACPNAVLLLCNDMGRKRDEQLARIMKGPVRFLSGIAGGGLVWWIVRDLILGLS